MKRDLSRGARGTYIVFCGLIGLAVWLVAYGLLLWILYGDRRIFEMMITEKPFAPLEQIWLYRENRALQKVGLMALAPAVLSMAAIMTAMFRRHTLPLADATFQTLPSLKRHGWFGKRGHVVGRHGKRLLRVDDDRHHMVIGPTRSGKGAGYVIPNALMHEGSMIVTDLKGEIFEKTAAYRSRMGSQVFLFAPGSLTTHRYNPLDFIRSERGDRTSDIQNVAAMLIPETNHSDNAIWQATAQQVLAGVISYVLESGHYKDRRNLGEVNSFFNCGYDLQVLMKDINKREPYLSKFTTESFNAYIGLAERAAQSALLDVQQAMRPFKNEKIVAATQVTDINVAAFRQRPISVYLAPNISDLQLLRPLMSLFIQQTMSRLLRGNAKSDGLPIYFLLDEFCQLKRMDEIVTKLPYVAGYGIKLAFIVQDLKSIDGVYGETARHSLLGNCGYQLVLGANDLVTADYVSRALGRQTVRYHAQSRTMEFMGMPKRSKVEQIRERDLMMPQEVRQMPADGLVILAEGQPSINAQKLRYFKAEPFRSAVRDTADNSLVVPKVSMFPAVPFPVPPPNRQEDRDQTEHGKFVH